MDCKFKPGDNVIVNTDADWDEHDGNQYIAMSGVVLGVIANGSWDLAVIDMESETFPVVLPACFVEVQVDPRRAVLEALCTEIVLNVFGNGGPDREKAHRKVIDKALAKLTNLSLF